MTDLILQPDGLRLSREPVMKPSSAGRHVNTSKLKITVTDSPTKASKIQSSSQHPSRQSQAAELGPAGRVGVRNLAKPATTTSPTSQQANQGTRSPGRASHLADSRPSSGQTSQFEIISRTGSDTVGVGFLCFLRFSNHGSPRAESNTVGPIQTVVRNRI